MSSSVVAHMGREMETVECGGAILSLSISRGDRFVMANGSYQREAIYGEGVRARGCRCWISLHFPVHTNGITVLM